MKPDESIIQQPRTKKDKKRNLCPFLSSSFKDCYSVDMNSNKISMVIYYCGIVMKNAIFTKGLEVKNRMNKESDIKSEKIYGDRDIRELR